MKKRKVFYGWWIVAGGVLMTATMIPPVVALFNKFQLQVVDQLNISRSAFTLGNTILQGLGIFLSPFISKKLAKGNMHLIQSVGVLVFALAYGSYSFSTNIIHFYLLSFVLGVTYLTSTVIPISMMVTNWFQKKRGLAMSIAMTGIGLGGAVLSPLVTWILENDNLGWRVGYRVLALIMLVIALPVSVFVMRKSPEDKGLKPYGAEEEGVAGTGAKTVDTGVKMSVKASFSKLFFILILIGMLANGLVNSGALGQFPPALETMHSAQLQATIISLYSFVGIFGKLILGWINDKFGVVVSSIFGCGFFALAFVFMLLGSNPSMLYIMAICFGLGMPVGNVSPPLVVSAVYGSEKYGEAYGITNSVMQLGMSLGSLMVALIYDTTKNYQIAWVLLLILSIVTLVSWVGSYLTSRKYADSPKVSVSN